MRAGQRLRAVDFAKVMRANAEERYSRSGREVQVYKENTYQRDLDRAAIARLLDDAVEEPGQHRHRLGGFVFTRSPGNGNLLTLITHFDIPNEWKAIGILYRGDQFHTMAAMSGWTHQEDRDVNIQIAGKDWTPEVFRLSEVIEHDLAPHVRDRGIPGQYHAYHAEKQLIAFFVYKHAFLSHEIGEIPDLTRLDLSEISKEEYEQREREGQHKMELSELARAQPAMFLKEATVLVSRQVCRDYACFVERINQKATPSAQ
jgi:hypothetical protein